MATRPLGILETAFACCLLGGSAPSQVPYPQWAGAKAQGGVSFREYSPPPEYDGPWGLTAKLYFPTRRYGPNNEFFDIQSSPTSSVLAFRDRRQVAASRSGIETGFDRVYSVTPIEPFDTFPFEVVVGGWDAATGTSRLARVSIPQVGAPGVSSLGPPSPPGEIWVCAGIVGEYSYVLDIRAHTIRRYVDQDGDGYPETRDPGFSLYLRPVGTSGDKRESSLTQPFDRFVAHQGALFAFGNKSCFSPRITVVTESGGPQLRFAIAETPPLRALRISQPLYDGQRRVLVLGPGGESFRLRAKTPGGAKWISSTEVMAKEGWIIVDTTLPVVGGWRISAVRSSGADSADMPRRVVDRERSAVFSTGLGEARQGTWIRFEGDRLAANLKAFWVRGDQADYELESKYVSERQIEVRLPWIEKDDAQHPFAAARMIKIVLEEEGSGISASNEFDVAVRFE